VLPCTSCHSLTNQTNHATAFRPCLYRMYVPYIPVLGDLLIRIGPHKPLVPHTPPNFPRLSHPSHYNLPTTSFEVSLYNLLRKKKRMAAPGKGKGKSKDFDFEFSGARKWRAYAEGEAAAASGSKVQTSTESATPQPTTATTPPPPQTESQPPAPALSPPTAPAQTYTVVSHARPGRSNPGRHLNYAQSGQSGRFNALPDIQAINRRRDHDVAPEGIVLNNEAHQRARAGEPPDGKSFIFSHLDGIY